MRNFYQYQVFVGSERYPSYEYHTATTLRNRLTWLANNTIFPSVRLVVDGELFVISLDLYRG